MEESPWKWVSAQDWEKLRITAERVDTMLHRVTNITSAWIITKSLPVVGPSTSWLTSPKGRDGRRGGYLGATNWKKNVAGEETEKAMSTSFDFGEQVGPSKRAKHTPLGDSSCVPKHTRTHVQTGGGWANTHPGEKQGNKCDLLSFAHYTSRTWS